MRWSAQSLVHEVEVFSKSASEMITWNSSWIPGCVACLFLLNFSCPSRISYWGNSIILSLDLFLAEASMKIRHGLCLRWMRARCLHCIILPIFCLNALWVHVRPIGEERRSAARSCLSAGKTWGTCWIYFARYIELKTKANPSRRWVPCKCKHGDAKLGLYMSNHQMCFDDFPPNTSLVSNLLWSQAADARWCKSAKNHGFIDCAVWHGLLVELFGRIKGDCRWWCREQSHWIIVCAARDLLISTHMTPCF